MTELQKLVKDIIADGRVDKDEVKQLEKAIYADGKVDKEEMDAMFEINDAVSGNDNCPEYYDLFTQVIADGVLNDDITPGVIDEEEGQYLVDKIQGDGTIDEAEKALLLYLEIEAEAIESESLLELIDSVK